MIDIIVLNFIFFLKTTTKPGVTSLKSGIIDDHGFLNGPWFDTCQNSLSTFEKIIPNEFMQKIFLKCFGFIDRSICSYSLIYSDTSLVVRTFASWSIRLIVNQPLFGLYQIWFHELLFSQAVRKKRIKTIF